MHALKSLIYELLRVSDTASDKVQHILQIVAPVFVFVQPKSATKIENAKFVGL